MGKMHLIKRLPQISYWICFSLILFLISSCDKAPIYQQKENLGESWLHADSVRFNLPAPDTSTAYAMTLDLLHTLDYPFQNIYFKITTVYPSGRRTSNLLNIDLADKSGAWYGNWGSKNCLLVAPLRDNFYFSEAGEYSITMEQFTRLDPLPGLTGLELKLYEEESQ